MSPPGFSFPPPPPLPPSSSAQQPQQPYGNNQQHAAYPSQYGQGSYAQRGGGRGGHHRGRGRGYGNRGGGGRGGHFMPSTATATPSSTVYATMNYAAGYAPAQYTAQQHQGYQNTPKSTTPYTPSHQYTAQRASYQHQPGYNATAAYAQPSTTQSAPAYPPVMPNPQPTQATQPPMMGPPMRWGFEHGNPAGSYPGVQASQRGPPRPFNTHGNPVGGGGQNPHANKRDHRSAFGKPQSVGPRVPAPPAVPSFGNPLPSKPPPPVDATRKPKKKKRKHNQLGLTPKTEDHESSEEEDDADEEAKLASGGSAAAAALQITYRGRTSTLNNPEEIAAWIAERKKRFPTKARVEEKKSAMEAAKKARDEALRQKKQDAKRTQKTPAKAAGDPVDEAAKAKQKADKLRRKLLKEQKRVEKAEADAERARMKVEQLQRASSAQEPPQPPTGTDAEPLPDQEIQIAQPMQQPALAAENPPPTGTIPTARSSHKDVEPQDDDIDAALSSSDVSDISDWTSSSGSDTSSDSDESDDDDSAPEEATSRREGPERVAPPPREVKKRICRHFARNGRCTRGDKCKFLHEKPEKPERGPKSKPPEKSGRKGLLQALLDRQKEDENRRAMEVIMWMGENGLLETPAASTDPQNGADKSVPLVEGVDNNTLGQAPGAQESMPTGEGQKMAIDSVLS